MNRTSIEWTDFSCTPLKMQMPDGALVNACVNISPGCQHCYAENYVRRFWKKAWGPFPGYTKALLKVGKPFLVEKDLQDVLKIDARIAAGKADPNENKVFWNDMTDEFLEFWPDEFRDRMFAVRALTPNLVHQVLTKRAERMESYLGNPGRLSRISQAGHDLGYTEATMQFQLPLENVWLGVSVENKKHGLPRIPFLLQTPAAVRFLSVEPLLEDLGEMVPTKRCHSCGACQPDSLCCITCGRQTTATGLDWVIVGGESGSGARPMHPDWVRSIRDQCVAAGVPFFFKQWGNHVPGTNFGRDDGCYIECENGQVYKESNLPAGSVHYWDDESQHEDPVSVRVGKKLAGRLLDGREWNEMPPTRKVPA